MASVTVEMPWMPGLTAGHAYRVVNRGMRITKEAREWRDVLAFRLRNALVHCHDWHGYVPRGPKPQLRVCSDWYSPQQPDQDNRLKLVLDALQIATGINDKRFTPVSGAWERAKAGDAKIVVTVEWD